MFLNSIRWQIQIWHSALLSALVALLTIGFYTYESRARLQTVDSRLQEYLTPLLPRISRPFDNRRPGERPPPRDRRPPSPDDRPPMDSPDRPDRPERRFGPPARPDDGQDDFMRRAGQSIYHVVWNREGEINLSSTNAPPGVPLPGVAGPAKPFYRTRGDLREYVHLTLPGGAVLVGTTIAPINAELSRLALQLTGTGILVVALGVAGGWWFANRAIRPIAQISRAAEVIAGGNLAERINVEETESELGELAGTLNRTFERMEKNFEREVHFTADASHELRTPIAVLLAETQRVLRRERTAEEYRQALVICERSGERMRALVSSLLELARIDSGEFSPTLEACDLMRVARESLEFIAPLALAKQVDLRAVLEPVLVRADGLKLGQVFNNLLTNAIAHNRAGTTISLKLCQQSGQAVFTITDNGAGIPAEALPQIFDRFSRVDKSRGRSQGGSGLGLSICQAIVVAHRGTIDVVSEMGKGTTFTVRLPLGAS